MNRTQRILLTAAVASTLAAFPTGIVSADPAPAIGAHQHFIVTPDGERHLIGPKACVQGESQGFYNFHDNIHAGTPFNEAFKNENNPVAGAGARCPLPTTP